MKAFLILWALSLAASDKLDRTYLPPPGSKTSGGHFEDLNLPLEFQKENFPSTLKPENDGNNIKPFAKTIYPNVAISIDRQGPSISSIESVSTGPRDFSKKIANSPSTIKPYAFTQTTPSSPIENYKITVGSVNNQEYTSTISPFDRNLNYPHQMINDLESPTFDSKISRIIPENAYDQSLTYSHGSPKLPTEHKQQVQHNFDSSFVSGDQISSNLTPQEYSTTHYPSSQYINFDSTSGVVNSDISTTPGGYYDQEKPKSYEAKTQQNSVEDQYYSTPRTFENLEGDIGRTSLLIPSKYTNGVSITSAPIKSSTAYSATPKYSSGNFGSSYNVEIKPERPQTAADRNALILNYENILTPEGFAYSYDTSNGIHADESGTANNGVKAQGSYSYIGDDGIVYNIAYTADENGFLPHGDHLPTAPPIPDAILKVIEEAEKNRKFGVIDDGTYDDSKYGHARYQGHSGRILPVSLSSTHKGQPVDTEYTTNTKSISIKKEDALANDGNHSEQAYDKFDDISGRPYPSYSDNGNREGHYPKEEQKAFSSDDDDQSYDRKLPKTNKIKAKDYQTTAKPTDDSTDNSLTIYGILRGKIPNDRENILKMGVTSYANDNFTKARPDFSSNADLHIPKKQGTEYYVGHDGNENKASHTGYDYVRPHQTFNDNYENKFQFGSPYPNGESINLVKDDMNYPPTFSNTFVSPKDGSEKNGEVATKLQPLPQRHRYSTANRNGIHKNGNKDQPSLTMFSNGLSEKNNDEPILVLDRVYQSTSKPEYGSTISNDQYPYTTTLPGNERYHNYPTSNFRSEYKSSTTPLPKEYTSGLPSSSIGLDYTGTTPSTSHFSTTARPVVSSKFFGSTTYRPDHTMDPILKQRGDSEGRISTTSPDNTPDISNGIYRHRGKPRIPVNVNKNEEFIQETPQSKSYQDGIFPGYGTNDHGTQNIKISTSPIHYGGQASTERIIGEDFSGPKQPQRFDPVHGYYY